jgi:hypothetical protein
MAVKGISDKLLFHLYQYLYTTMLLQGYFISYL